MVKDCSHADEGIWNTYYADNFKQYVCDKEKYSVTTKK